MEPMITNAPIWEFGKRQNGNRFVGYTSSGTDCTFLTFLPNLYQRNSGPRPDLLVCIYTLIHDSRG